MSDPFLGEVRMVGFPYAPRGWALCNGAKLPLNQYVALFSILGITYGGDGRTNFALPNLLGLTPMGAGNGAGLTQRPLGSTGGSTTVTLSLSEIPGHTHTMMGTSGLFSADQSTVAGNIFGDASANVYAPTGNQTPMSGSVLPSVGSGGAHNNMMPFTTVNFIIALQGIFPSRP